MELTLVWGNKYEIEGSISDTYFNMVNIDEGTFILHTFTKLRFMHFSKCMMHLKKNGF